MGKAAPAKPPRLEDKQLLKFHSFPEIKLIKFLLLDVCGLARANATYHLINKDWKLGRER